MAAPIKTWRNKGMQIAAWDSRYGKQFTWKKTYKDKNTGEYKEAKFLFEDDLPALLDLVTEAHQWARTGLDREADTQSEWVQQIVKEVVDSLDDDIPF